MDLSVRSIRKVLDAALMIDLAIPTHTTRLTTPGSAHE